MKSPTLHGLTLSVCLSGLLAAPRAASAIDFDSLNPTRLFHKEPEKSAPSDAERQKQEAAATAMYQDVRTAISVGDSDKAEKICRQIVKKYPYTDTAAEAQFTDATLLRKTGKFSDAFGAFQKVVEKFRRSLRFSEAVQQQFEIAEEAKSGKKQGTMFLIPMKIETSEVIKMYESIVKNAPYGKFAPLAQFSLGELYQERGEKDQAILAYQVLVDNYHGTKQSSEAEFRIASISSAAANKTEDASNRLHAREALLQYKVDNPSGNRVQEAESMLNQDAVRQAQHALSIGKFYERSGKPKAAAIYYGEALKSGSPDAVLEARKRLGDLASTYGDDLKPTLEQGDGEPLVAAKENLKARDDYAGPPAPQIADATTRKSKMRTDDSNFQPLPIKEPELPTKSDSAPLAPGMLIPPATGGKQLPLPPQPGGPLPVPPSPPNN